MVEIFLQILVEVLVEIFLQILVEVLVEVFLEVLVEVVDGLVKVFVHRAQGRNVCPVPLM